MTVLPDTAPDTAISPARPHRFVTLIVGLLLALSGVAPAAYVLLAM